MENQELNADEDPRSSIWTVPSNDLAKFFFVYALIYVIGSGCVVWLQLTRTASPHDIASGIITGVSLIGIGIAPSLALVLVETWRVAMIFTRSLELKQQRREIAIRNREREVQQHAAKVQEHAAKVQEHAAEVQEREAGIRQAEAKLAEERARFEKERAEFERRKNGH